MTELASAVTMAGGAALIASIPAALRAGGVSFPLAWVALAGVFLLPTVAVVLLLRGARRGLRELEGPFARVQLAGLAAWAVIVALAFAVLGTGLRATTHHHALAGVTFAILGLAATLGAAVVVGRAVVVVSGFKTSTRRVTLGAFWIAMGVAALLLGVAGGAAAVRHHPAGASAMVVDLAAFALATGFASRPLGGRETVTRIARFAPLAFLLVPAAVVALRWSMPLAPVLAGDAPLFALVAPSGVVVEAADTQSTSLTADPERSGSPSTPARSAAPAASATP